MPRDNTIECIKGPAEIFLRHPAHFIALGAGSGLSPLGPGTAGTLWAWMSFLILDFMLSPEALAVIVMLTLPLGVWACNRTGLTLGQADHPSMVIDEILAFWLILLVLPRDSLPGAVIGPQGVTQAPSFLWLACWAFLIFRVFDILKPPPIRWIDSRFKSGWGVMLDDLVAAGLTLFVLSIGLRLGIL